MGDLARGEVENGVSLEGVDLTFLEGAHRKNQ